MSLENKAAGNSPCPNMTQKIVVASWRAKTLESMFFPPSLSKIRYMCLHCLQFPVIGSLFSRIKFRFRARPIEDVELESTVSRESKRANDCVSKKIDVITLIGAYILSLLRILLHALLNPSPWARSLRLQLLFTQFRKLKGIVLGRYVAALLKSRTF